jgi:hypothetical protein
VVESSGLLNRRRVKNSTGGSNPPLSASLFFNNLQHISRSRGAIWRNEVWRSPYTAATAASAKGGDPHQFRSSEFEERKRGWKRCECPTVVAGTLNKKFLRQSTNVEAVYASSVEGGRLFGLH